MIVTVQDNGKGMTEEEVSKALEPFYTKSINGTGLGLSIVSRLVESNGGTMEIVSKPGGRDRRGFKISGGKWYSVTI